MVMLLLAGAPPNSDGAFSTCFLRKRKWACQRRRAAGWREGAHAGKEGRQGKAGKNGGADGNISVIIELRC
jgi:hypothetical protein